MALRRAFLPACAGAGLGFEVGIRAELSLHAGRRRRRGLLFLAPGILVVAVGVVMVLPSPAPVRRLVPNVGLIGVVGQQRAVTSVPRPVPRRRLAVFVRHEGGEGEERNEEGIKGAFPA